MTTEEMKNEFSSLYSMMAASQRIEYMRTFGDVHKEMMAWFIANKPELAQEWIDKLASIRWKNYLTPKEAEKIVSAMDPKAPWTREQWRVEMTRRGYNMESEPHYNTCALWAVMNMIMSDSDETLKKYLAEEDMFSIVRDLAVDKLKDKDGKFCVRTYFGL